MFSGRRRAIGLDIGTSSAKAVVLYAQARSLVGMSLHRLATDEEGILNERELYTTVSSWLAELRGPKPVHTVVGVPQYLATTQVSDFPATAGGDLVDMVAYETQQLAGLSDEAFIYDFHRMTPLSGRPNPVLIGICRESVIQERIEALEATGIELGDLAMHGAAIASAMHCLYPETVEADTPQVVVDLGSQSSTIAIVCSGQPLFVGSLLFGTERIEKALMSRSGIDEKNVKEEIRSIVLSDESPRSPAIQALRQLENELRNAIEHWRAQERSELAGRPLGTIWVCGGGAHLRGLTTCLIDTFEVPVYSFGPEDPETGQSAPEMVTAFGLALQGVGHASVALSLLPQSRKFAAIRENRFGFLVAAAVCIALLLCALLGKAYRKTTREQDLLQDQLAELSVCEQLIPRLQSTTAAIEAEESRIMPLVEKGNRPRRFINALNSLTQACGEKDWYVYLGDELSYQAPRERLSRSLPTRPKKNEGMGLFPPMASPGIGDAIIGPEFPILMLSRDTPLLESLIAAGYTELVPTQPYEAVREMVKKLNEGTEYRDVDLLPETERIGREDIFDPWLALFRKNPGRRYKAFTLRLPFAELDITRRKGEQEGAK